MPATVLVSGLLCTPQFYAAQLPSLWRTGSVQFANHTDDETMSGLARRILGEAPQRFALVGHSMGGYIAFEMLRQAPQRIERVAFLDTSALPDVPEQSERRRRLIEQATQGRFDDVADELYPNLVHHDRRDDAALREAVRQMARDTGAAAFIRQERAIISRADSRPTLAAIRCPTLVLVGEQDALTPPARAEEISQGVAGAVKVVVPDCGHMCAMERPEAVTAALERWLA
ncbi:MAG TPA: alpha/beta hydrolase [Casimicrobiaceae bacterium]|nr:alpha/beta hydrolase [Casimicrobiaceae bacterium]